MAKRRYSLTEDKIKKWIKEGRGSGQLKEYKPWLTIHDVPSIGNSSRLKGWKTSRIHHFLSNVEKNYFFLLEWSDIVLDIREQYPLNREETLRIAEKLNIPHPMDNSVLTVMTTDFLITVKGNGKSKSIARTIKPASELEKERVIEKLEIERVFWEEKNVDWAIVTDMDIPKEFAKNVSWLHNFYQLPGKDDHATALLFLKYLKNFRESPIKVVEVCTLFDEEYSLEFGSSINFFKHLLAKKFIELDMNQKINLPTLQVSQMKIHEQEDQNELYSS
ncbi:heteromeric transposase endonuclease subunit TnsA [Neobacillus notoginsengisoli]|uniref:Heteromeric transposase endonuclease subunit TnsA n=1 Tax=Neobacillus notoginsengisoli TaxID=1578198 RepID=A0A417YMH6_9BACI|nr:TnsA endonuclease N-terminal domain-containing protein [Neobacillus notoginsengisoli]RHW34812.1 heteromeric transposase endonuclease subunit TnsA [Neobacillus notoginsengisoli]